ncbi:hypothetical protein AWENTII_001405 [Aspergillus wentii]
MFKGTNYSNPFAGRAPGGQGPPHPPRKDGYDAPYGGPPQSMGRPGQMMPSRPPVGGRPSGGGQVWSLRPAKSPDNTYTFGNLLAVSPQDFPLPAMELISYF